MNNVIYGLATIALVGLTASVSAQGSGVCPGLTGKARTACLNAESQRGKQETRRIDRNNRRLDAGIDLTCKMRDGADLAAGTGAAVGGAPGAKAGGAWAVGRKAGNIVTRGKDKCPND